MEERPREEGDQPGVGSLTARNIVTFMSAARHVSFFPLIRRLIVFPFAMIAGIIICLVRGCRAIFLPFWQLLRPATLRTGAIATKQNAKYLGRYRKLISLERGSPRAKAPGTK